MKKTAAGLIIFTKLPHQGLVAVLSRRGEFDYEKFKPEHYPHVYEVTAGGDIHQGEHLVEGLMREVEEELGSAVAKLIHHYAANLHHVAHEENERIITYTYAIYVPHFPLAIIKPHRSSGGIKIISIKDLPNLKGFVPDSTKAGKPKEDEAIWIFADQMEGVKKGFDLYKHL